MAWRVISRMTDSVKCETLSLRKCLGRGCLVDRARAMFFRFMVERIAMRGRLAQGPRRLCRSCGTLYLYATLPALPCRAFTCRRYAAELGETEAARDTGTGAEARSVARV